MLNFKPLVSIGIPYLNGEKYIVETLESVKRQDYNNIELILLDDGSVDRSKLIVENWIISNKSYFTRVISIYNTTNMGVGYSSWRLVKTSSGKYFHKLDSDDLIFPSKISDQVRVLEENPEVALVYSNTIRMDSEGNDLKEDYFTQQGFSVIANNEGPSGYVFEPLLKENFIPASSVLVRKSCIDGAGGYDEKLYSEDWDMWLRITKKYKVLFMKGYYSKYRIHSSSMMQHKNTLIKVFNSLNVTLLKHLGMSRELDKIIAKHFYTNTIGLYRFGEIHQNFLEKNLYINKDSKSLLYYLLGLLNLKVNQKK